MPSNLNEIIEFQLDPFLAPNHIKEASILHVASNIAINAPFNEKVLELLNIDHNVLTEIIQDSLVQSLELIDIINPSKGN